MERGSAYRHAVWALLCFTLLVGWGGYLRFYQLGEASFWMDEAFSVQTARAIQQHGIPRQETGVLSLSWLPAHYLMAGSLSLGRDLHTGARIPSAAAGTLTILLAGALAFLLTRSKVAACLAACLVAFSYADIAWSRQARGYALLQALGLAALVFTLWGQSRRRLVWGLAASAALVLAILVHRAGYVYWLACAGLVVLEAAGRRRAGGPRLGWLPAALLAVPVLAGAMLPAGSSQGLSEAVTSIRDQASGLSYTAFYLSVIGEWWRWNVFWMVLGFFGLLALGGRKALPILGAAGLYLFVISEKTLCFQLRYLMPIVPLLQVAVATGPVWLAMVWRSDPPGMGCASRPSPAAVVWMLVVYLAWGATTATQRLVFAPAERYALGRTEPQADWKNAFQWLARQSAEPVTIMALPVFHDLYLGPSVGQKYFLPFTFSGAPGQWEESTPYSVATPMREGETFPGLQAFVVLDTFSFFALKDRPLRDRLARTPPAYQTPDETVVIWRWPLEATPPGAREDAGTRRP